MTIGLPGSGKTTWATIRSNNKTNVLKSADQYFAEHNNNKWNGKLLPKAHAYCQGLVKESLLNTQNVIIHNTNL